MKPATVDMLRAHLMVASLTAMGAEVLACVALLVLPVSQSAFSSMSFRLLAIAVIFSGVIVTRQFAHAAFELALQGRFATGVSRPSRPVAIAANCPRRWLVILHLRLTGRAFVLAEH
ncbi:hypothetical protein B0G80_0869 [Paraburkholderia sp. BL6669N2]|uniref:hypothetical protein n=1 Tax=Paraburkholderia sp. BL6669N2 TaxID=1938807 RepID=UPI000E2327C8|nr:hypothetical protein [Paraburkholderia sp. BL6669N2]REG58221.1 hypothetical protein B0G80_0869 [Paraburkholderia sp. BL6669N2]